MLTNARRGRRFEWAERERRLVADWSSCRSPAAGNRSNVLGVDDDRAAIQRSV
jgi:hypothetical protein